MDIPLTSAVAEKDKAILISVQISIVRGGLPRWRFLGLVSQEVREGKDRVLNALQACGIQLPRARVNIAFFPAEKKKRGTGLDLALAIALLQTHQLVPKTKIAALAELDLHGNLRPVQHEYALGDALVRHNEQVILPKQHFKAWRYHPYRSRLRFFSSLREVIDFLQGGSPKAVHYPKKIPQGGGAPSWKVSESLVRVLSICLAGGHHTFLFGSPGVGKSSAQEILKYLLPFESAEQLSQRRVQSSFLQQEVKRVMAVGPNVSGRELLGTIQRPGLLHAGMEVLFLDELPEYKSQSREALRQFLEITPHTQQAQNCITTIVATANPCPCGYAGTPRCTCLPQRKQQYLQRISGSLLDRFSLLWRVGEADHSLFSQEEWAALHKRIELARKRQRERVALGFPLYARNYEWSHLQRLGCFLESPSTGTSFRRLLFPLQVARTLADCEGQDEISEAAFWEAQQLCSSYSSLSMD